MMLLIVIMHISGGSIDLNAVHADFTLDNLWILCYRSITYLGVPCFAFISGYYGIICNYRKIWGLECMALFYGGLIILINFALNHHLSIIDIRDLLLPASSCHLWYYSAYILLALTSPFITPAINQMSKSQLLKSAIILLSISYLFRSVIMGFGNDFILLLSIYVMGQLLHRYPHSFFQRKAVLVLIICQCFNFALIFILLYIGKGRFLSYFDGVKNPLTVFSAICLFYVFLNIKYEVAALRKVATLAPAMLAVYIFHEGLRLSGAIDLSFIHAQLKYVIPISCVIILVVSLLDYCRGKLLNNLENRVFEKIKIFINNRLINKEEIV